MPLVRISRPRKVAGLLVASAALVLSVAACGGGSDSNTASTSANPGNGGGGNTAFAAYTQCLAKNGVTITMPSGGAGIRPSGGVRPSGAGRPSGYPRPSGSAGAGGRGFGGGGGFAQKPANVSQDTWDKATAACASVKPSFGGGGNRGGGNGADAAYRNCLQQHGVTMTGGKVDTTSSAYKTAEKTCSVLKPTASPTPTA